MAESLLTRSIKEKKERHLQNIQSAQGAEEDRLDKLRRNLGKVVVLPLADLIIEGNVRQEVETEEDEFRKLVESVRNHGVLQNLVVGLQMLGVSTYRLLIVAGQRRFLAAREAGLTHAPALLMEYQTPGNAKADGLRENLLRKDLYALDVAEAYLALVEDGWEETRIAREFEREPRTIRRYLAMGRYPDDVKALIRQHKDIFSARVLLREIGGRSYQNHEELREALKAKILQATRSARVVDRPIELKEIEQQLKQQLGVKAKCSGSPDKGTVTLSFQNRAEFNALLARLIAMPQPDSANEQAKQQMTEEK